MTVKLLLFLILKWFGIYNVRASCYVQEYFFEGRPATFLMCLSKTQSCLRFSREIFADHFFQFYTIDNNESVDFLDRESQCSIYTKFLSLNTDNIESENVSEGAEGLNPRI